MKAEEGRLGAVEWGVACRALAGERESGDAFVVRACDGGVLLAVVDGLGHGPEAAEASDAAAVALSSSTSASLPGLIEDCHEAMRGTRGAVMSLVLVTPGQLEWIGVGNVEASLVRREGALARRVDSALLHGGVVGYQLPRLHARRVEVSAGDLMLLATDGIAPDFLEGLATRSRPSVIAAQVLNDFGRTNDDALVLVARYIGEPE